MMEQFLKQVWGVPLPLLLLAVVGYMLVSTTSKIVNNYLF